MIKDDGGPAFPAPADDSWYYGASLRDYFASHATLLQSELEHIKKFESVQQRNVEAAIRYDKADAMLEARKK
jgi:hypothetical protein